MFQQGSLRGGTLGYATEAFAVLFGPEVARFYSSLADDPTRSALVDRIMAGSANLRKHFPDAPQRAEGAVMEVVSLAGVSAKVESRIPVGGCAAASRSCAAAG